MMSSLATVRHVLAAAFLCAAASAHAQLPDSVARLQLAGAGSEWERYLRVLQVAGATQPMQWTIRGLGPEQLATAVRTDSTHPWRTVLRAAPLVVPRGLAVVLPDARLVFNSAFPFGYNDGPTWAGRGLTASISGGVAARYGPFSLTLAPTYFVASNGGFTLGGNGLEGDAVFRNPLDPVSIDLPQRFGDGAYARVDWGESQARVDLAGLAVGVSTASQFWGPAVEHPLLLGNNAGGFPHVFAGTSRPVDLWIGRVHGRLLWGGLSASPYAPPIDSGAGRFAAGIVGSFSPRGLPGLELGVARFFHTPWPDGIGTDQLLKPLEGVLKQDLATDDNETGDNAYDNQLASLFARWVLPGGRAEVYGEYAREDHNQDGRDLALQPDHISSYLLGLQRVWVRGRAYTVGRAEVLNARLTHLVQVRDQSRFYTHTLVTQGHTQLGQVLGSAGAFGGGAAVLAVDNYDARGRWTVSWSRLMRGEARNPDGSAMPLPDRADVMHALGVDGVLFRERFDLSGGLTLVQNFNRDQGDDRFNVNLVIGTRARW